MPLPVFCLTTGQPQNHRSMIFCSCLAKTEGSVLFTLCNGSFLPGSCRFALFLGSQVKLCPVEKKERENRTNEQAR